VAGIAAAFAGVVLASRELHEDAERAAAGRLSVILALVAAAGFGAYFVGIDRAANESVFWALAASRACATAMLAGIALVVRPALGAAAAALPVLVLIGTLDLSATILYAFASTEGLLSVVGVLGSLYPVVTILLARALLGERIRRIQEVGVVTALAGVALIAAG